MQAELIETECEALEERIEELDLMLAAIAQATATLNLFMVPHHAPKKKEVVQ